MHTVTRAPMTDQPPSQPMVPDTEASPYNGPLDPALEQIALRIFARTFPMAAWPEAAFATERRACRRFALQLREDFRALEAQEARRS